MLEIDSQFQTVNQAATYLRETYKTPLECFSGVLKGPAALYPDWEGWAVEDRDFETFDVLEQCWVTKAKSNVGLDS